MWAVRVVLVGFIGAVLAGVVAASSAWAEPERIAGKDRVETAVAASQHGWESADVAVVAAAGDFPDALSGTALAAAHDAPLLLTPDGDLPAAVGSELERLGVSQVVVLGGESAVSAAVVEQIAQLESAPTVERISGDDRFATASEVARQAGAPGGEAIVVLGTDYPDAVSAGALAGGEVAPPVLLTRSDRVPEETQHALDELAVDDVVLVGGTAAVSDAVEADLADDGYRVRRLSGSDRYWTSEAVAREAEDRATAPDTPVLATGGDFPDALAAGALTARLGGVLTLASPSQPHPANDEFLRERASRWNGALTLGGTNALAADAVASIGRSLRGEDHPPEPERVTTARLTPGEIAVAEARKHLGTRYEFGGNGPDTFDCSGLTRWAWREAGVDMPRVSRNQHAAFEEVPLDQLRPGDLIAYDYDRVPGVSHIAIYSGDGNMIHATPNNSRSLPGQVMEEPMWRSSALVGAVRPK